jgi:parallel beta helix pectate lyase-like protein
MSDWEPEDQRFEEELRGLFAAVRVPPVLSTSDGTERARPPRWTSPLRLVAAGIATVLVAGGAAVAVRGQHGAPDPVASPQPTASAPPSPAPSDTRPTTRPTLPDAHSTAASSAPPRTGPAASGQHSSASSAPPAGSALPGPGNTGVPAGVTLRPSGSVEVTRPGTVLDGLDITGVVTIRAAGVTIRNSRIRTSDEWAVQLVSGSVTILDSELIGGHSSAIQEGNWRAYRVHIHDVYGDGVRLGSGSLLQDSYVHDVGSAGARMLSGGSNITLRHNVIRGGSSALFLTPEGGPDGAGPVTVQGNVIGGGSYSLYVVSGQQGTYHQRGYTITGNRWLRDADYGPVSVTEPRSAIVAWGDNTFTDGARVDLP